MEAEHNTKASHEQNRRPAVSEEMTDMLGTFSVRANSEELSALLNEIKQELEDQRINGTRPRLRKRL